MIDAVQIDLLASWAHRALPESGVRTAHPNLQRGSVFWYAFREPTVKPGELYKSRPVIIMDRDPLARLAHKLDLHVVPLSSCADNVFNIPIAMPDGVKHALTTHATTINSGRLLSFVKQLSAEEMAGLDQVMKEQLSARPNNVPRQRLDPGTVHTIAWHDPKHLRQVLLLTADHLKRPGEPAMALPVESVSSAEHLSGPTKPRPVSVERLIPGAFAGKISLGALKRTQAVVRQTFGLDS